VLSHQSQVSQIFASGKLIKIEFAKLLVRLDMELQKRFKDYHYKFQQQITKISYIMGQSLNLINELWQKELFLFKKNSLKTKIQFSRKNL